MPLVQAHSDPAAHCSRHHLAAIKPSPKFFLPSLLSLKLELAMPQQEIPNCNNAVTSNKEQALAIPEF
jgi:hypothetical protein